MATKKAELLVRELNLYTVLECITGRAAALEIRMNRKNPCPYCRGHRINFIRRASGGRCKFIPAELTDGGDIKINKCCRLAEPLTTEHYIDN